MSPNKSRPKAVTTMSLRVLRKIFVCFMGCAPFCYIRSLGKYFKPVDYTYLYCCTQKVHEDIGRYPYLLLLTLSRLPWLTPKII